MKNKLVFVLVMIFGFVGFVNAQKHEVGIRLGTSNLVGDIGRNGYVLHKPFMMLSEYSPPVYIGALYRYNLNPYQTLRFNIGYTNIQFDDAFSKEEYRLKRNQKGVNSMVEAGVVFEYNFLPVNEERRSLLSPYVFGGVSGLYMNSKTPFLNVTTTTKYTVSYQDGNAFTMAIPFGVGLKYKFNYNWALSGELTFRPTFSDKVDYSYFDRNEVKVVESNLDEAGTEMAIDNFLKQRNIGNINSKDWVNSATIMLTYSFGRPPCYCD